MTTFLVRQRQLFARQLAQACPNSTGLVQLKTYLSSYSNLISPSYKKTRDPLAMKELSGKCPSCSEIYSTNSFHYRSKLSINRRLHRLLNIRRRWKKMPTPHSFKRRLFDRFTTHSRSRLRIQCSGCGEVRKFPGLSRVELPKITKKIEEIKPTVKKLLVSNSKLKQSFEKASCRFLKKESNLRAFLEQL